MQSFIDKVKQKDRVACREIYDRYSKPMYNICLRMVNDEHYAHDILQEVFIRVFQHIDQLSNKDLLSAWIKKICVNTALQYLNQKKRMIFEELDSQSYLISINEEESIVQELEMEGNMQTIQKAVAMLPDRYRVVFIMHALEDYSHEEIARMLGIVSSTSRSQYLRAKQKLLALLKKNKSDVGSVKKIPAAI